VDLRPSTPTPAVSGTTTIRKRSLPLPVAGWEAGGGRLIDTASRPGSGMGRVCLACHGNACDGHRSSTDHRDRCDGARPAMVRAWDLGLADRSNLLSPSNEAVAAWLFNANSIRFAAMGGRTTPPSTTAGGASTRTSTVWASRPPAARREEIVRPWPDPAPGGSGVAVDRQELREVKSPFPLVASESGRGQPRVRHAEVNSPGFTGFLGAASGGGTGPGTGPAQHRDPGPARFMASRGSASPRHRGVRRLPPVPRLPASGDSASPEVDWSSPEGFQRVRRGKELELSCS
jgi:hypothetical protein